jgi:hypothetical protein
MDRTSAQPHVNFEFAAQYFFEIPASGLYTVKMVSGFLVLSQDITYQTLL